MSASGFPFVSALPWITALLANTSPKEAVVRNLENGCIDRPRFG
jgi:hypothetical protein